MVTAMRIILLAVVLAMAVGTGCSKARDNKPAAKAESKISEISVADVEHQLTAGRLVAVDANGEQTRKKMGVVPGAVLLTSSEDISALPPDKAKPLVFYCANTRCSASDKAASKAATAGYTNVKVMREGIAGWVRAGKQVQTL